MAGSAAGKPRSEPSNPWMSGLANLYSLDFFRLVRSRLNENGVFGQWIQSYEIDWDTFVLMGRTFKEVFPEGVLIKLGPGPFHLDSHMAIGLLMADKNDMEKAVQHFSSTLKISPINAQAQKYLGIAKFQQGKLDQAVFHLSETLEIMPDDASLVNELGKVLLKLKKSQ